MSPDAAIEITIEIESSNEQLKDAEQRIKNSVETQWLPCYDMAGVYLMVSARSLMQRSVRFNAGGVSSAP